MTSAKLGDVLDKIIDCEHKTAPETVGEVYAYSVGTPHLKEGRILYSQAKPISQETYLQWTKRGEPEAGDLILAREAPVGQVGLVGNVRVALGQRTVLLKVNKKLCVPRYLHYKLISPRMQQLMQVWSEGSTVAHLNVKDIPKLDIGNLPPLSEQRRVAEILGSLDDKIEANNALIESLEQLADTEFLRLLKLHEGSIEDAKYGDLAVFGGGTPSTKKPEYWEGGVINWVTPTDVTGLSNHALFESSRKITDAGLEACSSVLHPAGSILMTSRASIGFSAVNEVPAATNQGFIVVEPENADVRWWVYHHMKRDVGLFLQLSNGATFMELSRGMFKSLPLKLYRGKTALKDIHAQIISLAAENRELVETRDLLIRKLIK